MQAWSVGKRITLGFAIVLALLASLATLSFIATLKLSSVFDDYRTTARQTLLANEFIEDLFEARLAALKYRINGTENSAEEVRQNLSEILSGRPRIAELFGNDTDVMRQFDQMLTEHAQYLEAFEETSRLQSQYDALVADLAMVGPSAEVRLKSIVETSRGDGDTDVSYRVAAALQDMMSGRIHMEQYLLTNSIAAFDQAIESLGASIRGLEALQAELESPELGTTATQTIGDLQTYLAKTQELRTTIDRRNALLEGVLDVVGPKLQLEYELLLDGIAAQQNILGPEGSATASQTEQNVVVIAIMSLIIGVILSLLVSRSISRSISGMANKMEALARDDLDIEITGSHHRHELGRMAKALTVFRENALRVRQMTLEKEENDARAIEERRAMMADLQAAFSTVVDGAVAGDFSGRVPGGFPDAELNDLADGVNRLLSVVNAGLDETRRVLARVAEGDLTDRMNGDFSGAFGDLQSNVNRTVVQLSNMLTKIAETIHSVRSNSDIINTSSESLSSRAMQQASSLEETAATMEEMSASVKSNARSSSSARNLADKASDRAKVGGGVVKGAVSAMFEIEESSSRIGDIISVIEGIAFQTNLLALNAAVEAARAGDAGKGFAVVASEVRALAQRSSEAAHDITRLIETSEQQVTEGVRLVNETGSSLEGIVSSISLVEDAIANIAAASEQQASGVQEIAAAIGAIDAITQKNSSIAEQTASSAHTLARGAQELEQLISFFKITPTTTLAAA